MKLFAKLWIYSQNNTTLVAGRVLISGDKGHLNRHLGGSHRYHYDRSQGRPRNPVPTAWHSRDWPTPPPRSQEPPPGSAAEGEEYLKPKQMERCHLLREPHTDDIVFVQPWNLPIKIQLHQHIRWPLVGQFLIFKREQFSNSKQPVSHQQWRRQASWRGERFWSEPIFSRLTHLLHQLSLKVREDEAGTTWY